MRAILETLEWIIRSPRAWVIIVALAVYARTAWERPNADVLAVTGASVIGAIISHLWAEKS